MRLSRCVPALFALLSCAVPGLNAAESIATSFGGKAAQLEIANAPAAKGAGATVVTLNGRAVDATGDIAVGLAAGADADAVAASLGLTVVQRIGNSVVLRSDGIDPHTALRALPKTVAINGIRWSEPVLRRTFHPKAVPTDPRFAEQWYLRNDGSITGTTSGNDINVVPAWDAGFTGNGVRIAILDDGFDLVHEDLADRYDTANGRDFIGSDDIASFEGTDFSHGTFVSGCIGASRNTVGIVGPAYQATFVPLRIIGGSVATSSFASAFTWKQGTASEHAVSNNSWGPADDGADDGAGAEQPSSLENDALDSGLANGRGGKGTVYVFAAGNGGTVGTPGDTCDRDGYASNRRVIAVGATTSTGSKADYSEKGVSLFINAPVGSSSDSVARRCLSTDATDAISDPGNYTTSLGTSFAAPQVAGVIAQILQANPNLGWRDVRQVLAASATKNDPSNSDWITNAAGLDWSPSYGFGRVNAEAAVTLAQTWTGTPVQESPLSAGASPAIAIPDNGQTDAISLAITAASDFRVETVELTVNVTHPFQGDLAFSIRSPSGTTVQTFPRNSDNSAAREWTFTAVGFLNESANGTWEVTAIDSFNTDTGTLNSLSLSVRGFRLATAPGATAGATTGSGGTGVGGTAGATTSSAATGSTASPTTAGSTGTGSSDSGNDDSSFCGAGSGLALILALTAALRGWLRPLRRR